MKTAEEGMKNEQREGKILLNLGNPMFLDYLSCVQRCRGFICKYKNLPQLKHTAPRPGGKYWSFLDCRNPSRYAERTTELRTPSSCVEIYPPASPQKLLAIEVNPLVWYTSQAY